MKEDRASIRKALEAFLPPEAIVSFRAFGSGHINDTYLIECTKGYPRYVLQRINGDVFQDLGALNSNVELVTDFLREKIAASGGDPDRLCAFSHALARGPARDMDRPRVGADRKTGKRRTSYGL